MVKCEAQEQSLYSGLWERYDQQDAYSCYSGWTPYAIAEA